MNTIHSAPHTAHRTLCHTLCTPHTHTTLHHTHSAHCTADHKGTPHHTLYTIHYTPYYATLHTAHYTTLHYSLHRTTPQGTAGNSRGGRTGNSRRAAEVQQSTGDMAQGGEENMEGRAQRKRGWGTWGTPESIPYTAQDTRGAQLCCGVVFQWCAHALCYARVHLRVLWGCCAVLARGVACCVCRAVGTSVFPLSTALGVYTICDIRTALMFISMHCLQTALLVGCIPPHSLIYLTSTIPWAHPHYCDTVVCVTFVL